jgi:uncharacterized membrane protein YdjX (TVP38/TMEM64 family)
MKEIKKISIITIILLIIISFFVFDIGKYFTLEFLKNSQASFNLYYENNPLYTISLFFILYVLVTALSVPGAAVLTIGAGALFGLVLGTIIVSFASTIGATLAALMSRYILKDWVEKQFGDKLKVINKGIEKEGSFYLFTLRLIPVVPFFIINLAMGLTKMKLRTFFIVSQLGMLAGTIVYVNAGVQLASINSLSEIISFQVLLSFIILGLFPIVAKKLIEIYKTRFRK